MLTRMPPPSAAEGVQGAAVVICFMSRKYQLSANCQLELKFGAGPPSRIVTCPAVLCVPQRSLGHGRRVAVTPPTPTYPVPPQLGRLAYRSFRS